MRKFIAKISFIVTAFCLSGSAVYAADTAAEKEAALLQEIADTPSQKLFDDFLKGIKMCESDGSDVKVYTNGTKVLAVYTLPVDKPEELTDTKMAQLISDSIEPVGEMLGCTKKVIRAMFEKVDIQVTYVYVFKDNSFSAVTVDKDFIK